MLVIDEKNTPWKESEELKAKYAEDPLVVRRAAIEAEFLAELTSLTRKYGLAIKADTRSEYGDTYQDCQLETAGYGTAGRYQMGTFGLEWDAARGDEILPCSPEARAEFETARSARKAEEQGDQRLLSPDQYA